jgi:hypothetical protein
MNEMGSGFETRGDDYAQVVLDRAGLSTQDDYDATFDAWVSVQEVGSLALLHPLPPPLPHQCGLNHERVLCGALAPFMGQDDEYDPTFDAWVATQVVRLRYRFALLFVHFIPGLLRDSVRLFLKRQCDRTQAGGR